MGMRTRKCTPHVVAEVGSSVHAVARRRQTVAPYRTAANTITANTRTAVQCQYCGGCFDGWHIRMSSRLYVLECSVAPFVCCNAKTYTAVVKARHRFTTRTHTNSRRQTRWWRRMQAQVCVRTVRPLGRPLRCGDQTAPSASHNAQQPHETTRTNKPHTRGGGTKPRTAEYPAGWMSLSTAVT